MFEGAASLPPSPVALPHCRRLLPPRPSKSQRARNNVLASRDRDTEHIGCWLLSTTGAASSGRVESADPSPPPASRSGPAGTPCILGGKQGTTRLRRRRRIGWCTTQEQGRMHIAVTLGSLPAWGRSGSVAGRNEAGGTQAAASRGWGPPLGEGKLPSSRQRDVRPGAHPGVG